jgi:adenylylsulfate kinase
MFTLWFMGRPSAGKSTLASKVEEELVRNGYGIENLDGDEIRKHLHPDLGFSREDRRTNNRRTAYIAKLLNRNDIPVIVGMITPFRDAQEQAREIIEDEGDFVLIYVKCSVETAEERDPKGLYEQAKEGNIEKFTGIDHPFQEPHNPDIVVSTEDRSVDEGVEQILSSLEELGVLDRQLEDYDFSIGAGEERQIAEGLEDRGLLEEDTSDD